MSTFRAIVSTSLTILSPCKYVRVGYVPHGTQSEGFCSLSESNFEEIAEEALETLSGQIDDVLDKVDIDADVSLSNGVLTVNLNHHGTYVINKQTPNKQLWLSSPVSGPKRFDYMSSTWIYKREGVKLTDLLNKELSQLLNQEIKINI